MYLNYEVEFFFVYIECQYWTKDWICLAWLQIHGLLMSCYPKLLDGLSHLTPSQHLSMMMRKIFHCLGNHQLAVFSPINLVLSIVSLELEQITPNWFSIISMVQQVADVRNQISQFVLLIWLRWKHVEKLFNIILRIEGKKFLLKKMPFEDTFWEQIHCAFRSTTRPSFNAEKWLVSTWQSMVFCPLDISFVWSSAPNPSKGRRWMMKRKTCMMASNACTAKTAWRHRLWGSHVAQSLFSTKTLMTEVVS